MSELTQLNAETRKRLEAAKTELRLRGKHILQKTGSTRFAIRNECRDEVARLLRANGFQINCRDGNYEVTK